MIMMKCDPRAFAQCPGHQYCSPCAAEAVFMEGSECDKFNQAVLERAKKEIKCPCGLRSHMTEEDCNTTRCDECCPLAGGERS